MGHWVYTFSGCPGTGDFQQIADDEEPPDAVLHERPDARGFVDRYVLASVDDLMLVARFRWVACGDPSTVATAVRRASGRTPSGQQMRWSASLD
ncbi:hypothetical protein ACJ6WF_11655 [Streptomyces sp. MMS24-I2-30]|uniref:hypothetical protein n=1 Tax=Streptomyces sp. MMS24-I2-30 TaxID=3351564 RepID=UPI003896C7A5